MGVKVGLMPALWKASCITWDWKYVALSVCTCNGWPNRAYNICKARNTFSLVVLMRGMASNHLLYINILQREQVPMTLGADTEQSQDIHAPDLEGHAGLDARTMDILLFGVFLFLHLAWVGLLYHPVDFRNQAEHEDPRPAKVGCYIYARMPQELVGGLDNPMTQGMWDVETAVLHSVFLFSKAP